MELALLILGLLVIWLIGGVAGYFLVKQVFRVERHAIPEKFRFLNQNKSERIEKFLSRLIFLAWPLSPFLMMLLLILALTEQTTMIFRIAILKEKFSSLN